MKQKNSMFEAYSRYYDLLYKDKNYHEEVDYIESVLVNHNLPGKHFLEFGSGTGKHASLFVNRGYRVHGVEKSLEMVESAKLTDGFTCEVGDICSIHLNRTFDAVLSLFHVISYQIDNSSVNKVFQRAAEHLNPGGLFFFDVWYSPAVYAQKAMPRIKHISDEALKITRFAEPVEHTNQNRIDVNYTIFVEDLIGGKYTVLNEQHPMRHFSLPELQMIAAWNNFEWVLAEEFLTGNEPDETTWGVSILLRRV